MKSKRRLTGARKEIAAAKTKWEQKRAQEDAERGRQSRLLGPIIHAYENYNPESAVASESHRRGYAQALCRIAEILRLEIGVEAIEGMLLPEGPGYVCLRELFQRLLRGGKDEEFVKKFETLLLELMPVDDRQPLGETYAVFRDFLAHLEKHVCAMLGVSPVIAACLGENASHVDPIPDNLKREEKAVPERSVEGQSSLYVFRRKGKRWDVAFGGETAEPDDRRGMEFIAALIARPNTQHSALFLASGDTRLECVTQKDDPIFDEDGKEKLKARLKENVKRRREAERDGDSVALEELDQEHQFIADQLSKGRGIGGRPRNLGPREPARQSADSVRKALQRAYRHIADEGAPKLAEYLKKSIRVESSTFVYSPAAPVPQWDR